MVGQALRAVSRQSSKLLINYGAAQGVLPLRQQLARKLADSILPPHQSISSRPSA